MQSKICKLKDSRCMTGSELWYNSLGNLND